MDASPATPVNWLIWSALGRLLPESHPFADVGSCRVVVPGKFEMWMVEIGVRGSYLFWRVKPETFKAKCHPHLTICPPHFFKDAFVCGSPGLYRGWEFPTGKSLLPFGMKRLK